MRVAGCLETSLLDWEGKVSCVLFLSGCNFRCPWCQNKDLALGKIENKISVKEILQKFKDKKNWVDGFVITGGEPALNKDLKNIILEIRNNGFLVKVDTNGSRPDIIKDIISSGLVDFVSMDIKTALNKEKYNAACGIEVDLDAINKTIDILLNSSIGYSFRTTAVPGIVSIEDIEEIIKRISSAKSQKDVTGRAKYKRYVVQKFIPHNTLSEEYIKIKPYSEKEMERMEEMCYAEVF
ncbi:MAG: anaerobic ribonucleoside-triphosphate reductase activating protein [Elusimicrobia bacterium]|nr:anaerobic ribonucleoside-triphosphate reductase activating protein [Elusimicrobiota bacterium]